MSPHRFSVRIYYEDTDFSGAVYHAAYLKFFERGRTELLREQGIHHSALLQQGLTFAVRSMDIVFVAPARIDDQLVVMTDVVTVGGARLTLRQEIYRGEKLLTTADVVVVAINAEGGATRLPQALRSLATR